MSLGWIKTHQNAIDGIPPIMQQCIVFLRENEALEMEGIFRKSAKKADIDKIVDRVYKGEEIVFERKDILITTNILK